MVDYALAGKAIRETVERCGALCSSLLPPRVRIDHGMPVAIPKTSRQQDDKKGVSSIRTHVHACAGVHAPAACLYALPAEHVYVCPHQVGRTRCGDGRQHVWLRTKR